MPLDGPAEILNPLLDACSDAAHSAGLRVLQGHRFASTEAGHVSALLGFMAPPLGATVLDIGCGFGEVARLMRAERPDLAFVLLNRTAVQMRCAPEGEGFRRVLGDMHAIPLAAASVDGAMFNYALCHADQPVVLAGNLRQAEAAYSALVGQDDATRDDRAERAASFRIAGLVGAMAALPAAGLLGIAAKAFRICWSLRTGTGGTIMRCDELLAESLAADLARLTPQALGCAA